MNIGKVLSLARAIESIISTVLLKTPTNVKISNSLSMEIQGMYLSGGGNSLDNDLIVLNENPEIPWSCLHLLITVSHECRHAYQKQVSNGMIQTWEHDIKSWKESLNCYKDFRDGINEYYMQPIEVDAVAFSEIFTLIVIDREPSEVLLDLPDDLRASVDSRKRILINQQWVKTLKRGL